MSVHPRRAGPRPACRRRSPSPPPSPFPPTPPLRLRGAARAVALLLLAAPLAAQDTVEELKAALETERAAREALERRLAELESRVGASELGDLERRLQGLVAPGELTPAQARPPTSRAFYNPTIGVFMDAVLDVGNFDRRLDEEGSDKLLLRETEIDVRLPLSPFATGVGIFAWENLGSGEFEALVEEGYADISLGGLFDTDWQTTAKLGRFRPFFGRNNQLHLHDWLQVNQPVAVRNLLGDEGLVGEGVMIHQPLFHSGEQLGQGRATNLSLAIVNGELFTSEETAAGSIAEDAGDALASKGPMAVTRLSEFVELGPLSDVEFGVSNITRLSSDALVTESGASVDPAFWDADVTWRSRDDESGVGSWLVQLEAIRADMDDDGTGTFASQHRDGWWLTTQRQISPTVYLGLLFGKSEMLDSDARDESISPYVSWYADEFFRIRTQLEHLSRSGGDDDFSDANRLLMQFTWNFGAHQPHPYWVNR
jgi:hypothetical protein